MAAMNAVEIAKRDSGAAQGRGRGAMIGKNVHAQTLARARRRRGTITSASPSITVRPATEHSKAIVTWDLGASSAAMETLVAP
jgi:hypothetical protein